MKLLQGELQKIQQRKDRIITHQPIHGVRKDDEFVYTLSLSDETVRLVVTQSQLRFQKGDLMVIAAFETREGLKAYAFRNLTRASSGYKHLVYVDLGLGLGLALILSLALRAGLPKERLELALSLSLLLAGSFWIYHLLREVIRTLRAYLAIYRLEPKDHAP